VIQHEAAKLFLRRTAHSGFRSGEVVDIQQVQQVQRQHEPEGIAGGRRAIGLTLGKEFTKHLGVGRPAVPGMPLTVTVFGKLDFMPPVFRKRSGKSTPSRKP
jgi:hypothetical protein